MCWVCSESDSHPPMSYHCLNEDVHYDLFLVADWHADLIASTT